MTERDTQALIHKYRCRKECHCFKCELRANGINKDWEAKLWKLIKGIPIINIIYGFPRCIIMVFKKEWAESLRTASRVIGGIGEVLVFTSLATSGGTVIIALGKTTMAVTAGSVVGHLGDLGEMMVDHYVFSKNNLNENATDEDEKKYWTESRVYHGIIKDVAVVGAIYSAGRYFVKKSQDEHEEASESAKNAGINAVASALSIVISFAIAQHRSKNLLKTAKDKDILREAYHFMDMANNPNLPEYNYTLNEAVLETLGMPISEANKFDLVKEALMRVSSNPNLPLNEAILEVARNYLPKEITLPLRGVMLKSASSFIAEVGMNKADEIATVRKYEKFKLEPNEFLKALYSNCKEVNSNRRIKDVKSKYIAKCILETFLDIVDQSGDVHIDKELILLTAEDCILTGDIRIVQSVLNFVPATIWIKFRNPLFLQDIVNIDDRTLTHYVIRLLSQDPNTVPFPFNDNSKFTNYKFERADAIRLAVDSTNIDGLNVLCLDGGGTKGVFSIETLKCIARRLQALQILDNSDSDSNDEEEVGQTPTQFDIKNVFDYIAGTSTGGIIALGLCTNRSLDEITKLYFELKDKIFIGRKPYDAANYEKILQEFFGLNTRMSEIKGIRIIIPVVTGPTDNLGVKLFTNFDEDTMNEEIWKVARRTSAAPTFFDPMVETDGCSFYDGGVKANNPTRVTLRQLISKDRGEGLKHGLVLSLGTGRYRGDNQSLPTVRDCATDLAFQAVTGELTKIVDMFINELTRTDGDIVHDDKLLCKSHDCSYYRFNPILSEKLKLDETDDFKIINGLIQTKAYLNTKQNAKTIRTLTKSLLQRAKLRDNFND